jgi:hypothetical protein
MGRYYRVASRMHHGNGMECSTSRIVLPPKISGDYDRLAVNRTVNMIVFESMNGQGMAST